MYSQQLNQIRIALSITPRGPLAIRSGRTGADPTRADLECVRTTFEGEPSVFIPGSSLKGVMRSHAERLLRSENVKITDTFSKIGRKSFNQKSAGNEVYTGSCPIGRTFGNLFVKGRLAVSDHLPGGADKPKSDARKQQIALANHVEQRNGVAIDRLTGAASGGALFDQEIVVQGRFDGDLTLRNVQLYQLALVLFVLRDLDEGWLALGSGTTRGNGRVNATIRSLTLESRRGRAPAGKLYGYGSLVQDGSGYDLFPDDEVDLPEGLPAREVKMAWDRQVIPEASLDAFSEALINGPWETFLKAAQQKGRWSA